MREYKFRGKRLDNSEWVEGYFHKIDNYNDHKKAYIMPRYASTLYSYEVDPETVGQYTGLKDKNGVEIYEGDIVYIPQWKSKYKIVFKDGMYKCQGRSEFSLITANGEISCEVIGNIYDHKHLLNLPGEVDHE